MKIPNYLGSYFMELAKRKPGLAIWRRNQHRTSHSVVSGILWKESHKLFLSHGCVSEKSHCDPVCFSIQRQHAIIRNENKEIVIEACEGDGQTRPKTKVNGKSLLGPMVLEHLDRILFGKSSWVFQVLFAAFGFSIPSWSRCFLELRYQNSINLSPPIPMFSGENHLYVFHNPINPKNRNKSLPKTITWEYAQKEIAEAKGFGNQGNEALTKGNSYMP